MWNITSINSFEPSGLGDSFTRGVKYVPCCVFDIPGQFQCDSSTLIIIIIINKICIFFLLHSGMVSEEEKMYINCLSK